MMSKNKPIQKNFLEASEPLTEDKSSEESTTLYLLTNHYNLLDYLSSGEIRPASSMPKYYSDLGINYRESILLLVEPPFGEFVEKVTGEHGIPVIVELRLSIISLECQAISRDLELVKFDNINEAVTGAIVLFIKGMIPCSMIQNIYFKNEKDLKAFDIRKYANVPEHLYSFEISTDLFEKGQLKMDELWPLLEDDKLSAETSYSKKLIRFDSLSGAICLLSYYLQNQPGGKFSLLSSILNLVFRDAASKETELYTGKLLQPYGWIYFLDSIIESSPSLDKLVTNLPDEEEKFLSQIILIRILLNKLAETVKSAYSPDRILPSIKEELEGVLDSMPIAGKEEIIEEFDLFIDDHHDLRDGLLEFKDFFGKYPPDIFPAYVLLALFNIQSDPAEIISKQIFSEYISEDLRTLLVVLSGTYYGRSFLAIDFMPDISMVNLLDLMIAEVFNQEYGNISFSQTKGKLFVAAAEPLLGKKERLVLGNQVFLEKQFSLPDTEEIKALLNDCFYNEENLKESRFQILAVEICHILGWDDLIISVIDLEKRDFIIEHIKDLKELRSLGFSSVSYRLQNTSEFVKRIGQLDSAQINKINIDLGSTHKVQLTSVT